METKIICQRCKQEIQQDDLERFYKAVKIKVIPRICEQCIESEIKHGKKENQRRSDS